MHCFREESEKKCFQALGFEIVCKKWWQKNYEILKLKVYRIFILWIYIDYNSGKIVKIWNFWKIYYIF